MSVSLHSIELVKDVPVTFNSFGTAHGKFMIPASANPGTAHWSLLLGGKHVYLYHSFAVDNFMPPAMRAKIELASPMGEVKPGREIVIRFNIQYYSGGGVAGVPVECSASAYFEKSDDNNGSNVAYRDFQKWAGELSSQKLRGVSNADGNAEFRIELPEPMPDGAALSFFGTAKPSGMADMRAHAAFHVSAAGVFANPQADSHPALVKPLSENIFLFDVLNAAGNPCAFEGKAVFSERRWLEIWLDKDGREVRGEALAAARREEALRQKNLPRDPRAIYGDFYDKRPHNPMPEGWTKVFADYVSTPVFEQRVMCVNDGCLEIKFTPPREGVFEVRLEKDGNPLISRGKFVRWNGRNSGFLGQYGRTGEMHEGRWVFVAADENTRTLALSPSEAMILGLESVPAAGGLRALLVLSEDCRGVFLSLSNESRILTKRVILPGRVGMLSFDDAVNFTGKINAQAFDFWSDETLAGVVAEVPDAKARISLELSPAVPDQRPGDTASASIAARDFSGNPVRAEVAVSVADNALIEMDGSSRSKMEDPEFFRLQDARPMTWSTSGDERDGLQIGPVSDWRPGAAILALKEGKIEEANLIKLMRSGYIEMSEFAKALPSTMASYSYGVSAPDRVVGGVLGQPFEIRDLDEPHPHVSWADGIRLRRHFAWTAFWEPELVTDAGGRARVSFTYPDNLTQWRIAAYAVGEDGNTFGVAQALTRTSLPLQARVLAPRFLIEGDTAALPGLLVNRTDADLKVSANMTGEGAIDLAAAVREVVTPGQGEAQMSWQTKAREPGEAMVTLMAKAADASDAADAMQITLPVLEDGIRQDTAACARLAAGDAGASMILPLPDPLNRKRLDAEVVIAQGRASVMLDALPYLIDYPYGCVEQTMSRFLPAVIVKKTLAGFGFDAAVVEKRILDREPGAARARREQSAGLRRLDDVVAKSLGLLRETHQRNAGYGWWPGSSSTDLWMTAYVAWGLQLASEAGVDVSEDWLKPLRKTLIERAGKSEAVDDRLAWALFVMAEAPALKVDAKDFDALKKVYTRVYAERERLSASGRACLLVASTRWGSDAERAVLLRNLENGAQRTARGAHWGATGGFWRATEGAVESTALSAMALLKVAPEHALVEPALDWLALNRRGTGWRNTRASAFAVLALARSVVGRGEGAFEGNVDVFLNGKKLRGVGMSRESLLAGAVRVALPAELLRGGDNRIELRRAGSAGKGSGVLYASALASAWASGDGVRDEGNLVSVTRGFSGRRIEPTLGGDGRLRATALAETGVARAGDEVTARVVLKVPDELEYLMVAVPKPAGCEPLNPLSGWDAELVRVDAPEGAKSSGRRHIYREEHDDHSAFFLDHVEAGEWEIRFTMRAVTPGDFRALPVKVEAMYAPEVRANSDARRVRIE